MPNNALESIARENFRSSGYISHPSRDRRTSWIFSKPRRSPIHTTDAVGGALERRERALKRQQTKPSFIQTCLNAFFQR